MKENKPATSNSRQKWSHMNPNSTFKVSIDRITIIADYLTQKFDRIARDTFLKLPLSLRVVMVSRSLIIQQS